MPYLGKTPSQATRQRYYKTASGGETSLSGTMTTGGTLTFNDGEFVDVSVNGVALVAGTDYNTTTANTIGGLSALSANDQVEIVVYDTFSVFGGNVDGDFTISNGTLTTGTTSLDGAVTINESSADVDFRVESNGSANMLVVDGGNDKVGINTGTPARQLTVENTIANAGGEVGILSSDSSTSGTFGTLHFGNNTDTSLASIRGKADGSTTAGKLEFNTEADGGAIETRMTIDSSGNVGIGAADPNHGSHDRALLVSNTGSGARSAVEIEGNSSNANGTVTFLNNGSKSCSIDSRGTGTMTFNGASAEYLRADSDRFFVGKSTTNFATPGYRFDYTGEAQFTRNTGEMLNMNRVDNDGKLIRFFQGGTEEGSISVSGTTVTLNGGHLSRYSRLSDGSRPAALLRGTVMSNLDDMIVWSHDAVVATYYEDGDELPEGASVGDEKTPAVAAYTEDNEQLNQTKISNTEGDVNVAGVFVAWDDDDDDFEDFYLAMTGDMVIRIASGTTVARGDLLMSAGDGTAKPQGDDIVRSKTIAKVTSTTVSHTYDDGSYLVPCVLMAC